MHNLYTPQEIADMLKIKKNTVYELIKRGELHSTKIGKQLRISQADINEYLKQPAESGNSGSASVSSSVSQHIILSNTVSRENPIQKSNASMAQGLSDIGLIICGQDQILDLLCSHIEANPNGSLTFRSYMGSFNGLYSLYFKKVHVSTCHLWDSKTDTYNVPFIHYLIPGNDVIVIHLVKRTEGFYVKKGNPKRIYNFSDLTKDNVTFVNRERGSGARVLIDSHLKRAGIEHDNIKGYEHEVFSHLNSASTIASGGADVAVGIENVLIQFPMLDFIPIQEESLDLAFLKENLCLPAIRAMVEIIQSTEFREELSSMNGYNTTDLGKVLLGDL